MRLKRVDVSARLFVAAAFFVLGLVHRKTDPRNLRGSLHRVDNAKAPRDEMSPWALA